MSRLAVALAVLALSAGAGAGPTRRSATTAYAADTRTLIVARDISDLKTLDPGRLFEISAGAVASNVYDTLVTYSGHDLIHVRPDLATRWIVSRNNRVFTFYLRHDVRFPNGDPMTSADVVFSYRRLGYLNDNPAFLMGATTVDGQVVINQVRALGRFAVQFTLPAPNSSFLSALTSVSFAVLEAKVLRAHGGDDSPHAASTDKATDWLNGHSSSTGAFGISSWTRGPAGQVVLERNPHFWGPRPFLNKIIFQGISDATTQRLEVARGTVDVATNVDIDGARALHGDARVKLATGNTLDLVYLGMTRDPAMSLPLGKVKVRAAIRDALDYHGIIRGLLSGEGTQANSMIPVGMLGNAPGTNKRLVPHTNLKAARTLLAQAGYPHGFSITLPYPGGYTFDGVSLDLLVPKIAHDLAAVGIKATLLPEQLAVLLPAYRAGQVPFLLFLRTDEYPDPNDYAGPFSPGGGVAKRLGYSSGALSRKVTSATSTSDVKIRASLYHQIQKSWLADSPWASIVQPRGIIVLHRGVTNYRYSPVLQYDFRFVRKS